MPTITLLGWLHTILGVFAILTGVYTLAKNKVIETREKIWKNIFTLNTDNSFDCIGYLSSRWV